MAKPPKSTDPNNPNAPADPDDESLKLDELKAHFAAKLSELEARLKRRLDPEHGQIVEDELDLLRADLEGP